MKSTIFRLFGALAAVTTLAACGEDAKRVAPDEAPAAAVADTAAPAASEAPAAAEPQDADSGAAANPGQAAPPALGRQLVITSSLTIETADVGAAVLQLSSIAERNGGAVFNSDVSLTNEKRGRVTLRVPPAALGTVKQQIAGLGKVVGQGQSTEDVTDQVVDIDARVKSAQASVDRVRSFYEKAKDVKELTALESELTRRETDLEKLVAQQLSLADRVALSTINVDLYEPAKAPAPKVEEKPKKTTAGSALRGGLRALWNIAKGIAIGVAAIAPFLVILAVLWLPIRWLIRRLTRRSKTRRAATTVAQPTRSPWPAPSEATVAAAAAAHADDEPAATA